MERTVELVLIQRVVVVGRDGRAEACVGGRGDGAGRNQRLFQHRRLVNFSYRFGATITGVAFRHSDSPKERATGSSDEKRKYIWKF